MAALALETHPSQYRHWRLAVEPPLAWLTLAVQEDAPARPGYRLKLNSYDLGVDLELADAVTRLRFEHPEVRAVVIASAHERVFSAGANIHMLASSPHAFKVNFCKFTNETRLAMEDASANSGQRYIAACNGTTAGGGYELALACDRIYLVDDGHAAVSLPEVPLLGVLPGTGGLTRLVDKRKVRRDLADRFATLAEGVRGRRAVEWGLVDEVFPRGRFQEMVRERAMDMAIGENRRDATGITLDPLDPDVFATRIAYRHVTLDLNPMRRTADLTIRGPNRDDPHWHLRAFRELDDALVRLRFHHEDIGVVMLRTWGDLDAVREADAALFDRRGDWLAHETLLLMARTLRRLDLTSRSFFAIVNEESCFAGSLLELALAADRSFMLADPDRRTKIALTPLNGGLLPMTNRLSRLDVRYLAEPERVGRLLAQEGPWLAPEAAAAGLVTIAADDLDWDDELRVAIEERTSLSPDALTAMEANLRFTGPETMETRIFGRLSSWQNWVFSRPNAVGEQGALTSYGKPERPRFQWQRT
ncbi:MAG: 2,3-epoxybenzoyl-CoA dihydrolase [Bryobacteraceae bacterium]